MLLLILLKTQYLVNKLSVCHAEPLVSAKICSICIIVVYNIFYNFAVNKTEYDSETSFFIEL